MSIDTGQTLTYDPNFPTPNIDQPSQKFRDNFSIIKNAIESLQTAASDSSSIFGITTTLGSAGEVTIDAQFLNNSLFLPVGDPTTGPASAGMIRYDTTSSSVQFFNSQWNTPVSYAANGIVFLSVANVATNLSLNYTPSQGADAVNVSYLTTQLSTLSNSTTYQISQIANVASTTSNAVAAEATARGSGDTNLQNQINGITSLIANANSTAGSISFQVTSLQQSLSDETNARTAADTTQTNNINTLNNQVNNAVTLANLVASSVAQEVVDRQNGDLYLYNIINGTVAAQSTVANALTDEISNRQVADDGLTSLINVVSNNLANAVAQEQTDFASLNLNSYFQISGGTISGDTTIANSTLELSNSTLLLDAGQYFLMNKTPNTDGTGDGAFIVFEENSFDYARMTNAVAAQVAADIAANGLAVANTHFEFSVLRIGTTNDPDNGATGDSIAIEPAADLWLNPGWVGTEDNTGSSRTASIQNASVYVGNATNWSVQMVRATGDINTTGNITAAGDITGLSDESLKYNIRTIANPLDLLDQLRGTYFNRSDLPGNPEQMGVIAQEVLPFVPQVVREQDNGLLSVAYGNLVALLIESVKELRAEVESLKKDR